VHGVGYGTRPRLAAAIGLLRRLTIAVRGAAVGLAACRRGGNTIEFGIIAPVFLVLLIGTIEGGRMLWTLNALHYSVQEAARCASVNTTTCGTSSQITAFAATRSGAGLSSSVFTSTVATCGNQVSANYPMPLNIPFFSSSITLTAQSCYPI
jgi:Flp pilus assembly protein TadG